MKKITLIACSSKKSSEPQRAIELYQGDLFKKSVAYAHSTFSDGIYILSASKGLVHPSEIIEPYDVTLNAMSASERKDWAMGVLAQLELLENINDCHFVFLAGANYRSVLEKHLPNCNTPMARLGIGQQLQWLKEQCA